MLKGAIIGFGEVARYGHWPAYADSADAQIVAVVERSAGRRALAVDLVPGVKAFETIGDLARSTPLDFVDICTPPALHPESILEAVALGWHVLCEKPFLLESAAVGTVRRCADEAGVAVVPVDNWKYAPIVRAATTALRSGVIGPLTHVEIETVRQRAAPTADAGGANWRRDPAIAGGGILMDHGWHAVYLALSWFGDRATGVRASFQHPPGGGVEDEASLVVQFPRGEAVITLSWNGAVRHNAMRLVGTLGEIVVADDTLDVRGETTSFPSALSAGSHHPDWFTAMLPEVVGCFRRPERARPLFEEAAECLCIIQQAYRSDPRRSERL